MKAIEIFYRVPKKIVSWNVISNEGSNDVSTNYPLLIGIQGLWPNPAGPEFEGPDDSPSELRQLGMPRRTRSLQFRCKGSGEYFGGVVDPVGVRVELSNDQAT